MDWRHRAKCRESDPELFFPVSAKDKGDGAKRVCAGCPVRDLCLKFALDTGQRAGVWGGLNERELAALRRRNARARRTASVR